MPIESLVIETDAPDMIPMPHRQENAKYTRNSPALFTQCCPCFSSAKQLSLEQLAQILWKIVAKLAFNVKKQRLLLSHIFNIYPRYRRIRFLFRVILCKVCLNVPTSH